MNRTNVVGIPLNMVDTAVHNQAMVTIMQIEFGHPYPDDHITPS
ncbi:hypothetical protein [Bacillus sp. BHET2]|nr:hypothetical protein [Bacillus sp. BHET2]